MHPILAGALAVGIFIFTVGVGMTLINHSEVDDMIKSGAVESSAQIESLNDRTMTGVIIAGIGAGVTVFSLLIDEGRRQKESADKRSFFY